MFLFGGNKVKVRSEEDEDRCKTFIEYHGIKQKDIFKVNILKELIGDNFCLVVIDSKLLYCGPKEGSIIEFREIIDHLDFTGIAYKKFEIKKIPEVSMFGVTVKKGSKKTDKDCIVGFVVNKDNFKLIEEYVNKFNIYYFIDKVGLDKETLLKKLEESYEDLDEMGKDFCYEIFNNNFINQLVVLSGIELVKEINEAVKKFH